jgi:hypothetical protein
MRLKSAALFAVGLLFVSFWLHGGARCQSPVAPPLSIAPQPSVTDQGSPPPAKCYWGGLHLWCRDPPSPDDLSPRPTARGSPPPAPDVPVDPPSVILASPPTAADVPPRSATARGTRLSATKSVSSPTATDDVPPPAATERGSARSAAPRNSPPPANDKDAPLPAVANILPSPGIDERLPTPGIGKLSPSREPGPDGFTAGIEDGEETGQPLPIRPRPAKKSKIRQKHDATDGPSAMQSLDDETEVEKLKPNLSICRGC